MRSDLLLIRKKLKKCRKEFYSRKCKYYPIFDYSQNRCILLYKAKRYSTYVRIWYSPEALAGGVTVTVTL